MVLRRIFPWAWLCLAPIAAFGLPPRLIHAKNPLASGLLPAVRDVAREQRRRRLRPARLGSSTVGQEVVAGPAPGSARSIPADRFHRIDEQWPGLQRVHADPDVFVIDDFLSEAECAELQRLAQAVEAAAGPGVHLPRPAVPPPCPPLAAAAAATVLFHLSSKSQCAGQTDR